MYTLLIVVILLMYFIAQNQPAPVRQKLSTRFAYCICIMLVLLAAFRADTVGADTVRYRADYLSMGMYNSLDGLIDRFTEFYMGYFVPSKIFHHFGLPVQVWFGFVEAFYLFALMKLINMFSKDKIFSLLVFTTIGLWVFSMAGLKQTFAMAMMMLAFVAFMKKRYYLTAMWTVLVFFTHQAARHWQCRCLPGLVP